MDKVAYLVFARHSRQEVDAAEGRMGTWESIV